jgi:hypothetical protein
VNIPTPTANKQVRPATKIGQGMGGGSPWAAFNKEPKTATGMSPTVKHCPT